MLCLVILRVQSKSQVINLLDVFVSYSPGPVDFKNVAHNDFIQLLVDASDVVWASEAYSIAMGRT